MSGRAETMKLVKALQKQGFRVERTGSGHWMVYDRSGKAAVTLAFSPKLGVGHATRKRLGQIGYRS